MNGAEFLPAGNHDPQRKRKGARLRHEARERRNAEALYHRALSMREKLLEEHPSEAQYDKDAEDTRAAIEKLKGEIRT
jgi:hypothetical protein